MQRRMVTHEEDTMLKISTVVCHGEMLQCAATTMSSTPRDRIRVQLRFKGIDPPDVHSLSFDIPMDEDGVREAVEDRGKRRAILLDSVRKGVDVYNVVVGDVLAELYVVSSVHGLTERLLSSCWVILSDREIIRG